MLDQIGSLPLRQKVGQLFCIGIAGPSLDRETIELLNDVSPGGVCLFSRNVRERHQTRELLDSLAGLLSVKPILSVDQEGGLVDRLRRIMNPMPAASRLRSPDDAETLGRIIAETLLLLGFNTDFAPVVDVIDDDRASRTNGLFSREFGRSKDEVAAFAGRFLTVLQAGGIVGCLKHFPGLGAAGVDSHEELPEVRVPQSELESIDLFPYRELIKGGDVHAVMVAHAAFPLNNLQETDRNGKLLPSSLSFNFINGLLRGELGFNGLVITDDLEMGAIVNNYGIGEACKMAVMAGVDMLAICADKERIREGYSTMLAAVRAGEISEERLNASLTRIAAFKARLSTPPAFDTGRLDSLSEEIAGLIRGLEQD